jgi:hypothetical protein
VTQRWLNLHLRLQGKKGLGFKDSFNIEALLARPQCPTRVLAVFDQTTKEMKNFKFQVQFISLVAHRPSPSTTSKQRKAQPRKKKERMSGGHEDDCDIGGVTAAASTTIGNISDIIPNNIPMNIEANSALPTTQQFSTVLRQNVSENGDDARAEKDIQICL